MTYMNLPYLKSEDFAVCEYARAAALRTPIRDAINTARSMPDVKMEQVIYVLETALAHIKQGVVDEEDTATSSDDPIDELLGAA